jgi:serine/threonine protein phosphatase PrpC
MTLSSGAASDTGLLRDRNEDRFWADPAHGIYLVVDGVGGQAAGEVAAQLAVDTIRDSIFAEAPAEDRGNSPSASPNSAAWPACSPSR